MSWARALLVAVLLLIVFETAYISARFILGSPVDTDITSLLPAEQKGTVTTAAIMRSRKVSAAQVAFAVTGGTTPERQDASRELREGLTTQGIFRPVEEDIRELTAWVFANRTELLCPRDRERLSRGEGDEIAGEALMVWYSPLVAGNVELAVSDPLLLTRRLLECHSSLAPAAYGGTAMTSMLGVVTKPPYSVDFQDDLNAQLESWKETWEPRGLSLLTAGAVFHAFAAANEARGEITLIGGITTVGLLLLFRALFGSLVAAGIALVAVASGIAAGVAAVLVLFSTVHIAALVFGAAFIGIAVDYSVHYLVARKFSVGGWQDETTSWINRVVAISVATSAGAFLALAILPIPVFQQIAVLGASGLIIAWLGAMTFTRYAPTSSEDQGALFGWIRALSDSLISRQPRAKPVAATVIALIFFSAAGLYAAGPLDDVREIQRPPEHLLVQEKTIRSFTGFEPATALYVFAGETQEESILKEETFLRGRAPGLSGNDGWRPLAAASWFDPSGQRRSENRQLLTEALIKPHLSRINQALNIADQDPYRLRGKLAAKPRPRFVTNLRGKADGEYWSMVPASRLDGRMPENLAGPLNRPVVVADRYSAMLAEYRYSATWALLAALAAAGFVLLLIYREVSSLRILVPPAVAVIVTPGLLALAGVPYSYFSIMGLLVVFGAGIDYAVFQWESSGLAGSFTRAGVFIAAITTSMSMGLLGLSNTVPVMSFGVTVGAGILITLLLSPLAQRPSGRKDSVMKAA